MPPTSLLSFHRGDYNQKRISYRADHLILKVHSADESLIAVQAVISIVLDVVAFEYADDPVGRWAYLRITDNSDIPTLVKALNQDSRVDYAQPDIKMEGRGIPSDPLLIPGSSPRQWGPEYVNLYEVWDEVEADDSVLIGLVDSGVPLKTELKDTISLHDRLVGVVDHDDFDGQRFIAGYNRLVSPKEPWPNDAGVDGGGGHGTEMAGIIAAKENNRDSHGDYIGTAGANWDSPIYVVGALDEGHNSTAGLVFLSICELLEFAAHNGDVNVVINLSVNYSDDIEDDEDLLKAMYDMFEKVVTADAVICISAGNKDMDPLTHPVEQPAYLGVGHPDYAAHLLVVGAVNQKGVLYSYSGRGVSDMVFAPGVDVATTTVDGRWSEVAGTSHANALVCGTAALLWCAAPEMKAAELVKCIKNTCQFPAESEEITTSEIEELELGIVDAFAALEAIRGSAELLTPSILFDDTAPGLEHVQEIQIQLTCCRAATFTVSTTGHGFGIIPDVYHHSPCSGDPFKLVVTYAAGDGETEAGHVRIVWDQNPGYWWEVGISAQRLARRNSIFLVLDKSGSMAAASGLAAHSRMEVLQQSAGILVDWTDPGDGLGLISFDDDAHDLAPFTVIPTVNPDTARTELQDALESLEPDGMTSIAAGLLEAREKLGVLPDTDARAIIVITDGRETHEPWVEETMAEGFPYPVYAIGMGNASDIQPEALGNLADQTDGYVVLTGDLGPDTQNMVTEFLDQIRTEISGDSIAFDPTQYIRPGGTQRFPVKLSSADKEVEVSFIRPADTPLEWKIIDPWGRELDSRMVRDTVSSRLVRLAFEGPARHARSGRIPNGTWNVEVSVQEDRYAAWIRDLKNRRLDTRRYENHGAPYTLRVGTRSNIRMKCRTYQSGHESGSELSLRVGLTEKGRPLRTRPEITVELTEPDGTIRMVTLSQISAVGHETSITARVPGVYHWRIKARGRSALGHSFVRECHLTGSIWSNRGPQPGSNLGPGLAGQPRTGRP